MIGYISKTMYVYILIQVYAFTDENGLASCLILLHIADYIPKLVPELIDSWFLYSPQNTSSQTEAKRHTSILHAVFDSLSNCYAEVGMRKDGDLIEMIGNSYRYISLSIPVFLCHQLKRLDPYSLLYSTLP